MQLRESCLAVHADRSVTTSGIRLRALGSILLIVTSWGIASCNQVCPANHITTMLFSCVPSRITSKVAGGKLLLGDVNLYGRTVPRPATIATVPRFRSRYSRLDYSATISGESKE